MRVALDAQLAVGTATGIGEYVRGLAGALRRHGVDAVELRTAWLDPWRFDRRVTWDQVLLPLGAALSREIDLLHCAAGTVPWLRGRRPVVATVHDVAWLRTQQHARPYARWYFGPFAIRQCERAAAIIVDSAFSRAELGAVAPRVDGARVFVAHPGVADAFASLARTPAWDPEQRFALVVGTVEPRKNLERAIRALAGARTLRAGRADCRLVAVGPSTPYALRCVALARELGVAERVELCGYVPRARLLDLYARATVALVPSRYEGFGYAAAQALCAGVPLLAARAASLPEVVGGDAPLLDPDDDLGWAEALAGVLDAPQAAEDRAAAVRREAARRFGWDRCAEATVRAYRAALDR